MNSKLDEDGGAPVLLPRTGTIIGPRLRKAIIERYAADAAVSHETSRELDGGKAVVPPEMDKPIVKTLRRGNFGSRGGWRK